MRNVRGISIFNAQMKNVLGDMNILVQNVTAIGKLTAILATKQDIFGVTNAKAVVNINAPSVTEKEKLSVEVDC